MSASVISVITNAAIALVSCFIGIWLGKSRETVLADKLTVYNLQLQHVYEPLHELFMLAYTSERAMELLDSVFETSLSMVPPTVEEKYVALKGKKAKDLKIEDFVPIIKIIDSDYNWIRRKLGLPHENRKINFLYSSYGINIPLLKELSFVAVVALLGVLVLNLIGYFISPGSFAFSWILPYTFIPLLVYVGYTLGVVTARIRR